MRLKHRLQHINQYMVIKISGGIIMSVETAYAGAGAACGTGSLAGIAVIAVIILLLIALGIVF